MTPWINMFEQFFFLLTIFLGIISTNYLSHLLNSSIISSAAIGVLFGGIYFLMKPKKKNDPLLLVYLESFIGMTPQNIYSDFFLVLFLSITSLLMYILSKKYFKGYGGKLGSIAFFTSFIFYFLEQL